VARRLPIRAPRPVKPSLLGLCNTACFENISATCRNMNGVGRRGRDPQNCGVWDTVRGVRPPAIASYSESACQVHTAPAVHGGRRRVDSCSPEPPVLLRSRNDDILPRFVQRSLQNPLIDRSSHHPALHNGMSIAHLIEALYFFLSTGCHEHNGRCPRAPPRAACNLWRPFGCVAKWVNVG